MPSVTAVAAAIGARLHDPRDWRVVEAARDGDWTKRQGVTLRRRDDHLQMAVVYGWIMPEHVASLQRLAVAYERAGYDSATSPKYDGMPICPGGAGDHLPRSPAMAEAREHVRRVEQALPQAVRGLVRDAVMGTLPPVSAWQGRQRGRLLAFWLPVAAGA